MCYICVRGSPVICVSVGSVLEVSVLYMQQLVFSIAALVHLTWLHMCLLWYCYLNYSAMPVVVSKYVYTALWKWGHLCMFCLFCQCFGMYMVLYPDFNKPVFFICIKLPCRFSSKPNGFHLIGLSPGVMAAISLIALEYCNRLLYIKNQDAWKKILFQVDAMIKFLTVLLSLAILW